MENRKRLIELLESVRFTTNDIEEVANEIQSLSGVVVTKGALVCEHHWIHNTHTDTKYCGKGCDGFKIQEAN